MTTTNEKLASKKQIETYLNLCDRKEVTPDPSFTTWTIGKMSTEIERLFNMKKIMPASDKQIQTIFDVSERLGLPTPKIGTLDVASASRLIEKLFEMEKKALASKPTEKQIEMIKDMQLCPDVCPIDIEVLDRTSATEYIEKYGTQFRTWKYTRASDKQIEFIQTLQQRIGDVVMDKTQLIQFDRQQAKAYIDELQRELKDKRNTSFSRESTIDDRVGRSIVNLKQLEAQELKNITEMVHKLYASIGQEAEEDMLQADDFQSQLEDLIRMVFMFNGLEAVLTMTDKVYTEEQINVLVGLA